MPSPLMPQATAVWLIDHTSLTFDQIAVFCGLHPLEVKGIADGDVAHGIKGMDPVTAGQLTRDEIKRCEQDTAAELQLTARPTTQKKTQTRQTKYTPLSRRQDRPDAISWLVRNHPELQDAQISRLVGTTKPTIQSIRARTHWNISNIKPVDPVTLGLCAQTMLDEEVRRAAKRVAVADAAAAKRAAAKDAAEAADGEASSAAAPEDASG